MVKSSTLNNLLFSETWLKLWGCIVNAGPYCTNMPMKMCLLVRGLLVLKLSTLMNAICAVGLHQVMFF